MTPDEVINRLAKLKINMTRRTLLNYEFWGLIPEAERGGGGKGGRWADYPEHTIYYAYASWCLIHGEYGGEKTKKIFGGKMPRITPEAVAFIQRMEEDDVINTAEKENFTDQYYPEDDVFLNALHSIWEDLYIKALLLLKEE